MLNLVEKFGKYESTITRNLQDWIETYFKSRSYQVLMSRYERLRASINMAFPATHGRNQTRSINEFLSKVSFPLVRERYLFRRAVIKHNFRQNPIVTLMPTGNTPIENATNLQDVLNLNFDATKFRFLTFEKLVDSVARYGSAVCFSQFERSSRKIKRTQMTAFGPVQQLVPENRAMCSNHNVHILNYFQNPNIAEPEYSNIRGFVDQISVAKLIETVKAYPDNYIKENLKTVIEEAKTSSLKSEYYHHDNREAKDYSKSGIDIYRIFAELPIEGNEDDYNTYYIEMVGDKIIRFQDNFNDENICDLTVLKMRNHPEHWHGNTDPEDVFPHENFFNLFMNIKADSAIKQLERYIFYPKAAIDTAALNERHINGGFVPVDVKPGFSLNNMIFDYQATDKSLQSTDWLMREVKESAQKMSSRPDFLRSGQKGGLANNTATAANMLEQMGDYLESDMLEILGFSIAEIGRKNAIKLIQNLGERIAIRPDPKAVAREFYKDAIIGQYNFTAESSLQKSTIQEAVKLQNALTAIMNFKGSQDPTWQNVNMVDIARRWIKKLDVGDVDTIMPVQPAMQQMPGYQQSMNMPGQENAGAVQELPAMAAPELEGMMQNVA
jgi:hypothetical protein